MPDATAFHSINPSPATTGEIHKLIYKLRLAVDMADSYFNKDHPNFIPDEEDRSTKAASFWKIRDELASDLAVMKLTSPLAMSLRADALRTAYPGPMIDAAPSALILAVTNDLANLPHFEGKGAADGIYPSPLTPSQQDQLNEFANQVFCDAQCLGAIALKWMPQFLSYLPGFEKEMSEELSEDICGAAEYFKQLTEARVLLRSTGVLNVV
ncbi:hypothetical protein [Elstera cyanobacteriorum]|uniref:hypothetical protein n=1 Tax=Elstera cyanobacteriorum TaxID=2022747 RepID=UPI00235716C5|nr:hypothetical protein [Elstera cyanobacteriorum]MCK6444106.1 hypothetical protein [Elstera cyanobacteriorum]